MRLSMEPIECWHIVNTSTDHILEVCFSARRAHRAQKRWQKLWLWSNGPRTTIERVVIDGDDE